jgi:hypothetical protein
MHHQHSVKPRHLAPLFFALMLGASPLLAQTDVTEAKEAAPAATEDAAAKPAAKPAPPANSPPAQKSTGNSSPFDYRSSEEISEDVPVSFPVDI